MLKIDLSHYFGAKITQNWDGKFCANDTIFVNL